MGNGSSKEEDIPLRSANPDHGVPDAATRSLKLFFPKLLEYPITYSYEQIRSSFS